MHRTQLVFVLALLLAVSAGCPSESDRNSIDTSSDSTMRGSEAVSSRAREMLPAKTKEDLLSALRMAYEDGDVVAIQKMTKFPAELTGQQKRLLTIGARVIDENKLVGLFEQSLDTVSGTPEQLQAAGIDAVARLETEDSDGDSYNVNFNLVEENGIWLINQAPSY